MHVSFDRVSFSHRDSAPLFDEVSLRFGAGWTGVVGANGSGKTTLLRLLAGELAPETGRVVARAPSGSSVRSPRSGSRSRTPRSTASPRRRTVSRAARAPRSQLDPDALARWPTLSPGERKRWQIGAALAREPGCLVLDEPTNHLDADARALARRGAAPLRAASACWSRTTASCSTRSARDRARGARRRARVPRRLLGGARDLARARTASCARATRSCAPPSARSSGASASAAPSRRTRRRACAPART